MPPPQQMPVSSGSTLVVAVRRPQQNALHKRAWTVRLYQSKINRVCHFVRGIMPIFLFYAPVLDGPKTGAKSI